jgi:23S rRNA (guanosine2251-2'-O)-methyltransferase
VAEKPDVVYGWNAVEETLRAGQRSVEKVFVARGRRDSRFRRIRALARELRVPVSERPGGILDDLTGEGNHQGIVALVSPIAFADLDQVLREAGESPLFVLLDGVEDPHNLGAVIRTAAAAGATAVVIPSRRSAGISGAAAKAAAGGLDRIPVIREANIAQVIEKLKEGGIWIAGLDAGGDQDWASLDMTGSLALVVGGEGKGLRPLVRKRCDWLVRIPLAAGMESLNVSVAAAVALFEAVRQRQQEASGGAE